RVKKDIAVRHKADVGEQSAALYGPCWERLLRGAQRAAIVKRSLSRLIRRRRATSLAGSLSNRDPSRAACQTASGQNPERPAPSAAPCDAEERPRRCRSASWRSWRTTQGARAAGDPP